VSAGRDAGAGAVIPGCRMGHVRRTRACWTTLRVGIAVMILAIGAGARIRGAEAPAPAPKPALKEEVKVILVQIPILAKDKKGNPVRDLKPEEIEVKVHGDRLRVAYLEPFHPAGLDLKPLAPVGLFLDAPGGWQLPTASTTAAPHYVIFFIDVENDDRMRREDTLEKLVTFVEREMAPSTRGAVFSYDGAAHLELPFTTDRAAMASVLRQAWDRPPRPKMGFESRVKTMLSRFDDCVTSIKEMTAVGDQTCLQDVAREYGDEVRPRALEFLSALNDTIEYVAGLQGRKTILAVTHGVEMDPGTLIADAARSVLGNTDQIGQLQLDVGFGDTPRLRMDEVMALAVRNHVAIEFLDRMQPPNWDYSAKSGRLMAPGTSPMKSAFAAAQTDLEEIAVATGGVFVPSPDFLAGLRSIQSVEDGAYEVGYYLDEFIPEKDLVKVKVAATRKGVRVSFRRGFYARGSAKPDRAQGRIVLTPRASRAVEADPAVKPDQAAAPNKTAEAIQPGQGGQAVASGGGALFDFTIEADPIQIGYKVSGDEVTANFTLHVLVRDEGGHERVGAYHLLNHSYPLSLWKKGNVEPVTIRGWVELPPGNYTLVAVFRNTETKWMGEIMQTVTVPAPQPAS
jgi:VWFA-related protein